MPDPANQSLLQVLALTPAGARELQERAAGLSLPQRRLLLRLDGTSSLAQIATAGAAPHAERLPRDGERLVALGLACDAGTPAEPAPAAAGDPVAAQAAELPEVPDGAGADAGPARHQWARPDRRITVLAAAACVLAAGLGFWWFKPAVPQPLPRAVAPAAVAPSGPAATVVALPEPSVDPPAAPNPAAPEPKPVPTPSPAPPPPPPPPTAQSAREPAAKARNALPVAASAPPRDSAAVAAVPSPVPAPARAAVPASVPVPVPETGADAPPRAAPSPKAASTADAPAALQPLQRVLPAFPRDALGDDRREILLRAQLTVGAEGEVSRVEFPGSSVRDRAFQRAARAALLQWRFSAGAAERRYATELRFVPE